MKSILSGIGGIFTIIIILILIAFADLKEIIERHLFSIICVIAAIGALLLYFRSDNDDDSNTPLPPEKFKG